MLDLTAGLEANSWVLGYLGRRDDDTDVFRSGAGGCHLVDMSVIRKLPYFMDFTSLKNMEARICRSYPPFWVYFKLFFRNLFSFTQYKNVGEQILFNVHSSARI